MELSLDEWMAKLPEDIKKSKKITDIAIPGSHDCGTFALDKNLPAGPDNSDILQSLGNNPILGSFVKSIIFRWSTTQHSSVLDQLNLGIRYLDFRIAKIQEKYRILHGLYGTDIFEILDDIQSFLANHCNEIVILHFQAMFDMTDEDHLRVISKIEANFGNKLLKHEPMKEMPTIGELQAANLQVLVIYDISSSFDFLWPNEILENPWANTMNTTVLFKFLMNHMSKRPLNGGLYVSQTVLTPQVETILLKPFSTLFKATKSIRQSLPAFILEIAAGKKLYPNIIMTDFISDTNITSLIISLNYPIKH